MGRWKHSGHPDAGLGRFGKYLLGDWRDHEFVSGSPMKRAAILVVLFLLPGSAFAQMTATPMASLGAAGPISTTDTMAICQTASGCAPGTQLKAAMASQLATFLTGGLTPATSNLTTQAFVKALQLTPPTVSWLVGANPNTGEVMGNAVQAMTINKIYCRPTTSGDSGATIDVYMAPSGTGGTNGTKLNTISCNPSLAVNTDQVLFSGTTTLPAGDSVYLVATGTFSQSSGGVSMQVVNQ